MKTKSGSSRSFEYRGRSRTVESIAKASKASSGSFDSYIEQGVQFFKAKDGDNNIRIMPLTWDDLDKWGDGWAIYIDVHYGIGADNSAYLCLEKMKGEDCPICAARADTKDEDEQNALRINRRALCWVIDRDNEKAGPQAWAMPLTLFREINNRSVNKSDNTPMYIDDPDEGYDVAFVKEGKELRTKYVSVEVSRDVSALSDNSKRQARWLALITETPLPEILQYYDEEHLEKVLHGKAARKKKGDDDDDGEDDEEDEAPKKRGKGAVKRQRMVADEDDEEADERATRSNKKRVTRDEDDDEEEADEEADADDEEEKPTKRRAKGKAKAKDDDEEEADEEADADDEEEITRPTRRPAKGKARRSHEDDDDDGSEEDDDTEQEGEDDEEKEAPSKRGSKVKPKRGKAKADDDEDEEVDADDEEEVDPDEEEDDEPKGKSASNRAKAKLAAMKNRRRGR
jgi:hypothetical protein